MFLDATQHRLEKKNARETVKQAQEEAVSRRMKVAAMRAAEMQARKASAYPDATRVFVNSPTHLFCCCCSQEM